MSALSHLDMFQCKTKLRSVLFAPGYPLMTSAFARATQGHLCYIGPAVDANQSQRILNFDTWIHRDVYLQVTLDGIGKQCS